MRICVAGKKKKKAGDWVEYQVAGPAAKAKNDDLELVKWKKKKAALLPLLGHSERG